MQTIGRCAFEANKIKAVTIPSSVTTIDGNAFYNNSIETINMGSGVRTIGNAAFVNNTVQTIYIDMSQNEWNENVRFKDNNGNISTSAVWYDGNPTIRYKTQ